MSASRRVPAGPVLITSRPSMRNGVEPKETLSNVTEPSQAGTCALTSGSTSALRVFWIKVLIKGHSCATIWFIHSALSIAPSLPALARTDASISEVEAVVAAMVPVAVVSGRADRWGAPTRGIPKRRQVDDDHSACDGTRREDGHKRQLRGN